MEIQTLEFDVVEFEGADGVIHTIRQCSLVDREELRARLNQLSRDLQDAPATATIHALYDAHPFFRHRINRALELCGIKPEWVGIEQMVALLFNHQEDGETRPGWLMALNFPKPKTTARNVQSFEESLATLSTYFESLTEALHFAKNYPVGELNRILEAKQKIIEKQRREMSRKPGSPPQLSLSDEQRQRLKDRYNQRRGIDGGS